jgi:hypothetical protein
MMKTLFSTLILLITSHMLSAQLVALHSASGVTHYSSGFNGFEDAYNAATNGDTIYLPGGAFDAPQYMNKQLFVYGAGYDTDSTQVTGITIINGDLFFYSSAASGSHYEGILFNNNIERYYTRDVDNITFVYCHVKGGIDLSNGGSASDFCSGFTMMRCIVEGTIDLDNATNASFFNSLIEGEVDYGYDGGHLFENNVFFASTTSSTSPFIIQGQSCILRNNIFIGPNNTGVHGSVLGTNQSYNNLYVDATPSYDGVAAGNYTGVAVNAVFLTHNSGDGYVPTADYHLQTPGLFLGTDGTQVGIYGGAFPWKEGGVPSNPHFQFKTIGATTNNNGQLNVEIKVAAQDE